MLTELWLFLKPLVALTAVIERNPCLSHFRQPLELAGQVYGAIDWSQLLVVTSLYHATQLLTTVVILVSKGSAV